MKARIAERKSVRAACAMVLSFASSAGFAAEGDDQGAATSKLKEIAVTGSLIPQAEVEGASPVITITNEQMERQGFLTVSDALHALPQATGSVEGAQWNGGATQGATTISLLGLDPAFTLTTINGHPVTTYPLPYNTESNIVDLSSIPMAMVDHIDVLLGGQSAIYGSAAIAGVVNIVLKDNMDGSYFQYRAGGYTDGGGANQRAQFMSGASIGPVNLVYGAEFSLQQPIWAYQRRISASTYNNPDPTANFPGLDFLRYQFDPNTYNETYLDPPAGACQALSQLFSGTEGPASRDGFGNYCGSPASLSYFTVMNRNKQASGYLRASWDLSGNTRLYTNLLYTANSQQFNVNPPYWYSNSTGGGTFFNQDAGQIEGWQRTFSPEEQGGRDVSDTFLHSSTYNFDAGINGTFGQSGWNYDAYYNRSQFDVEQRYIWPLADIDTFFLGPQIGTDPDSGLPIYAPDVNRFYQPLTPAEFQQIVGRVDIASVSWQHNVTATMNNTELFKLPAGDVGAALIVTAGHQEFNNPPDPAISDGEFLDLLTLAGGGKESNYAIGGELRIPVFSTLTLDLSDRFDRYIYAGNRPGKNTYKVGLEYRPTETLLLRGSYATAFQAPQMAYLFAQPSGYYEQLTDYYLCRTQFGDQPLANCPYYSQWIQGVQGGNVNLRYVTANSIGYGAVWSPQEHLTFKLDYTGVQITNEVQSLSGDQVLQFEAACLIGTTSDGQPFNSNCSPGNPTSWVNLVTRFPDGTINYITTYPLNIAKETLHGISATGNYSVDAGRYGRFAFELNWFDTLKHTFQQDALSALQDMLGAQNTWYNGFKNTLNGTVTWDIGAFTTTLFGTRYGKSGNYAYGATYATGSVAPWMIYNLDVRYAISDDMNLSLIVNNLKNSAPPRDATYNYYPYYNVFNYNPYGRAISLQFDVRFGSSKS